MSGDAVKVTGIDLALQAATEFREKFPDPIKRPAMNRCVHDFDRRQVNHPVAQGVGLKPHEARTRETNETSVSSQFRGLVSKEQGSFVLLTC